ncbi:MAG: 2Fe-2S iron-sulfur cluster-binding protein [Spirochaetia bacterium]|nr:2Fe-2S iron-sulfur cluster-binding protein [Spirochaetia bacterium]
MVNITVDGQEYSVDEKKNLIDALKDVGIHVPTFCYHPKLKVAGLCRLCLIEIEGVPKLQAGCATPVKEGMKILVSSEKIIKAREAMMEFQLINHPLDCPVCDKAGECKLQDYSFSTGQASTRYKEAKRFISQEVVGDNLLINHNRCILCLRCVRFSKEILNEESLERTQRGNNTVIACVKPGENALISHNYQGALSDICPVGALLNKNMLFKSRVWWYEKTQTICHGCSTLCKVTANVKNNEVYRYMPPENKEKDGYFICDKGRFSAPDFSKNRLYHFMINGKKKKSTETYAELYERFKKSGKVLIIGGTTESNEDLQKISEAVKLFEKNNKNTVWEFKTEDYMYKGDWNSQIDFLLTSDVRPNSKKAKEIAGDNGADKNSLKKAVKDADIIFVINELSAPFSYKTEDESALAENMVFQFLEENKGWDKTVLLTTHNNTAAKKANIAWPIQSFVEKDGTYTDKTNTEKKSAKSVKPPEGLKNSGELFEAFIETLSQKEAIA